MDITPTPELRAACRLVLGVGGLAAPIGTMGRDTCRWAQAASLSCIVPASRSLTVDYSIDTTTLGFADRVTTGAIAINDLTQVLKVDATGDLAITEAGNTTTGKIVVAGATLTDNAGIPRGMSASAPNATIDPLYRSHRVAWASRSAPQTRAEVLR
jgi:hypothetical protein